MSEPVKVGSISYFPNRVIGEGSFGTRVYHGRIGQGTREEAAIKIVPLGLFDMKEVRSLESLQHKNKGENMCQFIVKYLLHEISENSPIPLLFLATELCSGTLEDFVLSKKGSDDQNANMASVFDVGGLKPKDIMHQLAQAISFLHYHGFVHRDIKPKNCLISQVDGEGKKMIKLSDFGLCGVASQKACSTNTRSLAIGSYGWMAPEVALTGEHRSSSIDIFSLGCVWFYVLSNGKHIFGDTDEDEVDLVSCQKNINRSDGRSLDQLQYFQTTELPEHENSLVRTLILKMVSFHPDGRPSAEDILQFPLFLDKLKLRGFLHSLGNIVDVPKCKCKSKNVSCTCGYDKKIKPEAAALLQKLNETDISVMKGNWYKNLETIIQSYCLTGFSRKDGENMSALCRAIRNNIEHFAKYQGNDEVMALFRYSEDGVIEYYLRKFPDFLCNAFICYHEAVLSSTSYSRGAKLISWRVSQQSGVEQNIDSHNISKKNSDTSTSTHAQSDNNGRGDTSDKKPTKNLGGISMPGPSENLTISKHGEHVVPPADQSMGTTKQGDTMDPTTSDIPEPAQPENVKKMEEENAVQTADQISVDQAELQKMTEEIKSEFTVEDILSNLSGFLGDGVRNERNLFGRNMILEMSMYLHGFKTYHNMRITDKETGIQVNSRDRKKCLGKSCAIENGLYSIVEQLQMRGVNINIVK